VAGSQMVVRAGRNITGGPTTLAHDNVPKGTLLSVKWYLQLRQLYFGIPALEWQSWFLGAPLLWIILGFAEDGGCE
jgi:hypothetical protein